MAFNVHSTKSPTVGGNLVTWEDILNNRIVMEDSLVCRVVGKSRLVV